MIFLSLFLDLGLAGCNASFADLTPTSKPSISAPPSGPPPVAGQSGSVTITPQYIALAPGQTFQFTANVTGAGQLQWFVNDTAGGGGSTGTITSSGEYHAPGAVSVSENVVVTAALAGSGQKNFATAVVSIIQPGQISCPDTTHNPLVALYSIYLPSPGKVSVQFGKTTFYGLNTWQVATPTANGGGVQIWVAGMLGETQYHMRAEVVLDDGATYTDPDVVCKTGIPPATSPVEVTSSGVPQQGIEMFNTILPSGDSQAFATDLNGDVIWTYAYQHSSTDYIQGVHLLPDGNLLMVISYLSSMTSAQNSSLINEIREVDLGGNTVRSLTMDALNQKLKSGNFRDGAGNLYRLGSFHHDIGVLPNGHLVLLGTYARQFNDPKSPTGTTTVIGDALIDVDSNYTPDWVWNTFDHLDLNRRPMNYPDWTHSNGILYSSDDHNLLLSMRHQNWIIKINFLDGAGSGAVMWRLGEGGDFKLQGATDPTDWFYAQHGMNYFSPNTTGTFRIGLMDNGNDRITPTGQARCQPFAATNAQCYSTMPLLQIDETAMTATMISHYVPPDSYFSFFGGNAELLSMGDMEVDFCAATKGAIIQELDPRDSQVIWQAVTPGASQFHAFRRPSLYPGVQW
jgi:arylsulfate sulfotransferase